MKWHWSLIFTAVVAAHVPAQETSPASAPGVPDAQTQLPGEVLPSVPQPTAAPGRWDGPSFPVACQDCPPERADRFAGNHNFSNFINWVSNPLSSIDPRAVTALYPIFGSEWVQNAAPIPNADLQVYGPAISVALSERFAFGLNQGGYAVLHPSRNPLELRRLERLDRLGRFREARQPKDRSGWLNIGGFLQYTLIEDVENQFLLTAGLRWIAPAGSYEIFQGHGPLELAPYLTVGKEFGKWHVLGTVGYEFPAGPGSDNLKVWYANVHIDRQCFGWLYPLIEFNSNFLTKGVSPELRTRRGFIDFGNFEVTGNIVSMAVGANAVLIRERLELGAVYTTVIASQRDFSANGMIVKMTLRY